MSALDDVRIVAMTGVRIKMSSILMMCFEDSATRE
jgi:hypothetical protein